MLEDKISKRREIYPELEPAYLILDKISEQLESAGEDQQKILFALESSLDQYDQAKEIFLVESQPWPAAWANLKKASLHIELAQMANAMGRAVQVHTAMELIKDVLTEIPSLSPSMDLAAKLYIVMIDTLIRIRSFFKEPEQLEALDDLIRGVAESLGEAQALDLLFRAEANDLVFSARILEALANLEEDPQRKGEMMETSRGLSRQAAENLMISSTLDLSGYKMSREEK